VWNKVRGVTGIPDFDTHELRHTGVSWAIHAGANVKTIQRMVGHASAAMTLDVYGHLWDDELDDVVGRVDELLQAERDAAQKPKPD
jgi:integrase